jgi:hypothetical protein
MHLVDKHLFPKDYDFSVVNGGIDHRTSMLRIGRHRKRSSATQHMADIGERARRRTSTVETVAGMDNHKPNGNAPLENSEEDKLVPPRSRQADADADVENLTGAMLALKFVPQSVRFGRGQGRGRGGFSRT